MTSKTEKTDNKTPYSSIVHKAASKGSHVHRRAAEIYAGWYTDLKSWRQASKFLLPFSRPHFPVSTRRLQPISKRVCIKHVAQRRHRAIPGCTLMVTSMTVSHSVLHYGRIPWTERLINTLRMLLSLWRPGSLVSRQGYFLHGTAIWWRPLCRASWNWIHGELRRGHSIYSVPPLAPMDLTASQAKCIHSIPIASKILAHPRLKSPKPNVLSKSVESNRRRSSS